MTRRDLVAKTDFTTNELGERLQMLEGGGHVDQISDGGHKLVALAFRGEYLVGGYR